MAAHHSPSMMQIQQQQQQGAPHVAPPPPAAAPPGASNRFAGVPSQQVSAMTEAVWMQIGSFAELVGSPDEAMQAYENALRANRNSIPAMNAISLILRTREEFHKAVEYLQAILKLDSNNGEVWGSLGHCYLMMDDLQEAYTAYQNALVNLPNVKEPKLWYGIGILYDRYGSLEHAEEAFSQVMQMQPDFEKANEIYFRLGIIYKQQGKYAQSYECFKWIVTSPPHPLTEEDIWFQIGHVHEQQKDYDNAKAAYLRVLDRDPAHAKVLQQLGWLHHQQSNSFSSQERAIEYLEKSVAADPSDAQSWYLLGRCYMSQQKYPKAYEAYQQAVYRDGRNPTFWCSIGVLYYQINQYRDALDAYSRAIRLNPYISEVWYDLGTLMLTPVLLSLTRPIPTSRLAYSYCAAVALLPARHLSLQMFTLTSTRRPALRVLLTHGPRNPSPDRDIPLRLPLVLLKVLFGAAACRGSTLSLETPMISDLLPKDFVDLLLLWPARLAPGRNKCVPRVLLHRKHPLLKVPRALSNPLTTLAALTHVENCVLIHDLTLAVLLRLFDVVLLLLALVKDHKGLPGLRVLLVLLALLVLLDHKIITHRVLPLFPIISPLLPKT
ncbi:General transcriptional corepressor ssn6 [Ceratocystis platani]|uniref:General transcriptional corepressor ssn6 n=1 Tax=Ceratocystis fimbriata f. sp. platani TaxID=88771 RepID=A0A0F8BR75_CERFI|nr:General transcriptional corepressor ssn6 [Ceratocystis platani]